MSGRFTLNKIEHGWWVLRGPYGSHRAILSDEELIAIHLLTSGDCGDEECPCRESGYHAAQDSVGEWHRPPGG